MAGDAAIVTSAASVEVQVKVTGSPHLMSFLSVANVPVTGATVILALFGPVWKRLSDSLWPALSQSWYEVVLESTCTTTRWLFFTSIDCENTGCVSLGFTMIS